MNLSIISAVGKGRVRRGCVIKVWRRARFLAIDALTWQNSDNVLVTLKANQQIIVKVTLGHK